MLRAGWVPLLGWSRTIPLCPVAILRAFKTMDATAVLGRNQISNPYQKANRVLCGYKDKRGLIERAGIDDPVGSVTGRHSPRVGGACTLLRAGLSETIVQKVGFSESPDMVGHYAKQMIHNPLCVEPFAFYNPRALEASYSSARSEPPRKRVRTS